MLRHSNVENKTYLILYIHGGEIKRELTVVGMDVWRLNDWGRALSLVCGVWSIKICFSLADTQLYLVT